MASIKYSDGSTLIGSLNDGNIDGYIVYFDSAGSVIIGTYSKGSYVGKLASANTTDFSANKMSSPGTEVFKSVPTSLPGK
jgi:hypothetical protein